MIVLVINAASLLLKIAAPIGAAAVVLFLAWTQYVISYIRANYPPSIANSVGATGFLEKTISSDRKWKEFMSLNSDLFSKDQTLLRRMIICIWLYRFAATVIYSSVAAFFSILVLEQFKG